MTVEAQVFINGNQLDVGRELARRAVVCELFLATDPLERKFSHEISDEWLTDPRTRGSLLAVAWAAVRHWRDGGRVIDPKAKHPSFGAYTELVGSIVAGFGMGQPFAPSATACDTESAAIKELLDAAALQVASSGGHEYEFTNPEMLALAEARALLDVILPYARKEPGKALGKKLATWRGRVLKDKQGRQYEFGGGRREDRVGALYLLTLISP